MGEKFNSGYGGYTCDTCRTLLWAGPMGSDYPERRRYIYSSTPEGIKERDGYFFCSDKCKEEHSNEEPT